MVMALHVVVFLLVLGFIHSEAALVPKSYDYEVILPSYSFIIFRNKLIMSIPILF